MKSFLPAVAALTAVAAAFVPAVAEAKKKPREAWTVSRTSDPITGDSSCVVTAYDTVAGMKYSRFGFLYPVVENNSKLGLLIGVSSGGQYRVPTGDILWRIDSNPHRTLRAADNPATAMNSAYTTQPFKTGNAETDKRIAEAMAQSGSMVAAITATSTMASGELAQDLLTEMVGGQTLLYRQAQVAPAYGLPSSQTGRVGQYTSDEGQVPFKLDASFHRGLKECGIAPAPKPAVTEEASTGEQAEQQQGVEPETGGN
ncbi:hypothetical protein AMC99_01822 [Altererythrobacter epoxidivorans]|uniref:Uncharacterized protein n=1 Tax=Altererythrobacter epoxidivorans TaxID=361183 RepID=A0A0M4M8S3_9SPHN|nr:hypothetical protein [Altererythrobacter epoxidivorans]ALE17110.1 hypothetical protein AMC99_01822 [Altererythrobacter epoxidivorans]